MVAVIAHNEGFSTGVAFSYLKPSSASFQLLGLIQSAQSFKSIYFSLNPGEAVSESAEWLVTISMVTKLNSQFLEELMTVKPYVTPKAMPNILCIIDE